MKKQLLLLCYLLIATITVAQTSAINGRVSIFDSKNEDGEIEYVEDVRISTPHSKAVQTDYKGRFRLELSGHKADEILPIKAEKDGYEVVDQFGLQNILKDRKYTFRVFLAKKGTLEDARYALSVTTKNHIDVVKNDILDAIAFEGVEREKAIKDLEKRSGEKIFSAFEAEELVVKMNEHLQEQLPDLVFSLVNINPDFSSKMFRSAFKSYQAGKLEETISKIDEPKLEKSVDALLKMLKDAKDDPEKKYKLISIRMNILDQIKNSYLLKIIALQQSFQFKKADVLLDKFAEISDIVPAQRDIVLMEKLKKPDFSKFEIKNEEIVLKEKEDTSLQNRVNKAKKTSTPPNDIIRDQKNNNEATKTIISVNQIGEEKNTTEVIKPFSEFRSLSEANVNDFENTLFSKKGTSENLAILLNREKPVGTSYQKQESILISRPVTQQQKPSTQLVVTQKPSTKQNTTPRISKPVKVYKPVVAEPIKINPKIYEPVRVEKKTTKKKPKYVRSFILKRTSLRKSPAPDAKVLKRLAVGTEVKVIKRVDKFWKKVILDGKVGYVKSYLLEKL